MLHLHKCSKRQCFFIIDIITILRYCYDNVITISYNNRNEHRLLPFHQKTWEKKHRISIGQDTVQPDFLFNSADQQLSSWKAKNIIKR